MPTRQPDNPASLTLKELVRKSSETDSIKSQTSSKISHWKITWKLKLDCGRPSLALGSALIHQKKTTNSKNKTNKKNKQKAKRAAGIEGQVATMLK